jgi:hypothetical protein
MVMHPGARHPPAQAAELFVGCAGSYVWHRHVLEHEDNETMRPCDVLPAQEWPRSLSES